MRDHSLMRQMLFLAALVMAGGVYTARFADQTVDRDSSHAAAVRPTEAAPQAVSYGRTLTLEANRQGHFQVEARVEGRSINFMVDSGASLVVLRETDAANIGIHPAPRDYTAT